MAERVIGQLYKSLNSGTGGIYIMALYCIACFIFRSFHIVRHMQKFLHDTSKPMTDGHAKPQNAITDRTTPAFGSCRSLAWLIPVVLAELRRHRWGETCGRASRRKQEINSQVWHRNII
jgi:hypothetical protein